jgi:hypothetical protein
MTGVRPFLIYSIMASNTQDTASKQRQLLSYSRQKTNPYAPLTLFVVPSL